MAVAMLRCLAFHLADGTSAAVPFFPAQRTRRGSAGVTFPAPGREARRAPLSPCKIRRVLSCLQEFRRGRVARRWRRRCVALHSSRSTPLPRGPVVGEGRGWEGFKLVVSTLKSQGMHNQLNRQWAPTRRPARAPTPFRQVPRGRYF